MSQADTTIIINTIIEHLDKQAASSHVFSKLLDFWIFVVLALLSILFSLFAFLAAKSAKEAAKAAGRTVKIQTVTIELMEIIQKMDRLEERMNYKEARDFYSETNRKIRRFIPSIKSYGDYTEMVDITIESLNDIKRALEGVKPNSEIDDSIPNDSIFVAVESHFSNLSGILSELMGTLEMKNSNID